MNIYKFMNIAKEESKKSTLTDWRIGAVIVKGNKIISRGHNKLSGKMQIIEQRYNIKLWSLHAEMLAIMDCKEDINGSVLFIAGTKMNGNAVYCRPCKHCMKMIKQFSFHAIYYLTKDGFEAIYPKKEK
jgi:deoxycytidylate deaminase